MITIVRGFVMPSYTRPLCAGPDDDDDDDDFDDDDDSSILDDDIDTDSLDNQ